MTELRGRTALVTGASSGLGASFAEQLAALGADLVITARREDRLRDLAARLEAAHRVAVTVIPLDLAGPGAAEQLFAATEGRDRPVHVLVNNAGFGTLAPFVDVPIETTRSELQLNVVALTDLCRLFAHAMADRGDGHVLNVASFAAWTPVPFFATYAAGKAYVRHLSEALAEELRDRGVRVCALCPGAVDTEFWDRAGPRAPGPSAGPDEVARAGLDALFRGRASVLPGWINKLQAWFMALLPRRLVIRLTARIMRPG